MIEKLLVAVQERQRDLERSVFNNPPVNMEDFKVRLGRWLELDATRQWAAELVRQADSDEDDPS